MKRGKRAGGVLIYARETESFLEKYWGKRAGGVLIYARETESFLVLQRSGEVFDPFVWGIPGGKVEEGEDLRQGVWREVLEEVGSGHCARLGPCVHTFFDPQYGFEYHTFIALEDREFVPVLNWENINYRWASSRWLFERPTGKSWGLLHPNVRSAMVGLKNGLANGTLIL